MTDNKDFYSFSDYVLKPARRELKQRGEAVDIEPRAFDLLVYLVQHRERAVHKEELQDVIWPGMIVTETALTRAVMKARKAIGDDASRQEMIKTLHGHGYRFVAKLSAEEQVDPGASKVLDTDPQPRHTARDDSGKPARNLRYVVLAGIATILLSGLIWTLIRSQPVAADETRIAVLPLSDLTENQDLAWTRFGLMSYASKLIASDASMLVVPVGSIISLTENLGWSGDLADPENENLLNKLKQAFAATHVLAMNLETEGLALRMNYDLLGPDGKRWAGTIVGDSGTDLAQGVVQAVYHTLFRKSRLRGDVPLVSDDSFNNEAFARGMDLSLQGRCPEAVQFFRVIIEQEPSLFAPRFEYASCMRIMGESGEAESLLKTLVDEQRTLGNRRSLAQSLLTLGILYARTGRPDLAQPTYEEALQNATDISDHVLRARVLQNISILFKDRSDLDEATRLLDLAVLAYQDAGIETLPGQLYSGRANIKMARGEFTEAEVELQQALKAFREIGDRRSEAMMLNNTGYLRRRQGRLEEAEAYHLRSLEIREEIGDRVGVGRIYGMLGVVYSARGQYQDAIDAAESALGVARETSDRLFEATSLAQLGDAEKAIGKFGLARMHYLEGRAIFVEIHDTLRVLQSDLLIARLDLLDNRLEQAETTALEVLDTSGGKDIVPPQIEAIELLGDIAMARDDPAASIEHYTNGLERVRETSWSSKEGTLEIKLANAYMDRTDLESAAPLIGALAGQQTSVRSFETQARYAFMRGEADQAVELMTRARTLAGDNWTNDSENTLQAYLRGNLP